MNGLELQLQPNKCQPQLWKATISRHLGRLAARAGGTLEISRWCYPPDKVSLKTSKALILVMNGDLGVRRTSPVRARRDRHDDGFITLFDAVLDRVNRNQGLRRVRRKRDLARSAAQRVIVTQSGGPAQCIRNR